MTTLPVTPRTTPHRRAQRVSHALAEIHAVLDEALVAHVGFSTPDGPVVLPINSWRVEDGLYFHMAPRGRLTDAMAAGAQLCVTVTLMDGLVLARSAMHHSMNFRSVMLFGSAEVVSDPEEKNRVLTALIEHVVPGRSALVRPPDAKELAATAVFRLPIAEATFKTRSGPPMDRADDLSRPVAAGVVPLRLERGALVEHRPE